MHVLEGSVRKAGDKLRITAQLINVADGFHLWSETYDGDMKDILAVQSDVAKRVVQALQVQLGVDEARAFAKKATENPEAHRLYLLGRYHFDKFTRAGWTNAIHYYEEALQVDPNFALAYCGLADTYGWAGGQLMPGREAWAKEMELAQKALDTRSESRRSAPVHGNSSLQRARSARLREGTRSRRGIESQPGSDL